MSAAMTTPNFVRYALHPQYQHAPPEDPSSTAEEEEDSDSDEHIMSNSRKPLMSPRKRSGVTLRQPPPRVNVHPLIKKRVLRWFYVLLMALFISMLVFVLLRITSDVVKDEAEDEKVGGGFSFIDSMTQPIYEPRPIHVPPKDPQEHQADTVIPQLPAIEAGHDPAPAVLVPCSGFDIEDVWVQNIPKLLTETAFRLLDVNSDGVLDVIMGFSTGITSYFGDQYLLCDVYFNGTRPCFGGLLALDGRTGDEIWRHYAPSEIFAVNCNVDIDHDGVRDCLGSGRAGAFELVSGATGRTIWAFDSAELLVSVSNFYTGQFIRDRDGDDVEDVLNIHGGDPLRKPGEETSHVGIVIVLSGATGHVIASMRVPDNLESYYSPQVFYQLGGREMVLFGTGGETHGGSLWIISMEDILKEDSSMAIAMYTDPYKGVMTPPVLADITGDGGMDIIMSMFNSTTVAFDGQSYAKLWSYTMTESETYSTPAAAYYNDDDVPDFMITYSHGPGYPVYYHSQVTILDGRTGQPLLDTPIQTAGSSQVSPLTVSMEGPGNDLYLYFILDCLGHEGETGKYSFAKGTEQEVGVGTKSRSDFCRQRFGTESFSRLSLLGQHMKPPGQEIYNSLNRKDDEYKYKVNSSKLARAYLDQHPQVLARVQELALEDPHSDHSHSDHPHSENGDDQRTGNQDNSGSIYSESGGAQKVVMMEPSMEWDGRANEDEAVATQADNEEEELLAKLAELLGLDPADISTQDNPRVDGSQQQDVYPHNTDVKPQMEYPPNENNPPHLYPQGEETGAAPQKDYPLDGSNLPQVVDHPQVVAHRPQVTEQDIHHQPRLGFDDEDEMPYIGSPVNKRPHVADSQDLYPQENLYPQEITEINADNPELLQTGTNQQSTDQQDIHQSPNFGFDDLYPQEKVDAAPESDVPQTGQGVNYPQVSDVNVVDPQQNVESDPEIFNPPKYHPKSSSNQRGSTLEEPQTPASSNDRDFISDLAQKLADDDLPEGAIQNLLSQLINEEQETSEQETSPEQPDSAKRYEDDELGHRGRPYSYRRYEARRPQQTRDGYGFHDRNPAATHEADRQELDLLERLRALEDGRGDARRRRRDAAPKRDTEREKRIELLRWIHKEKIYSIQDLFLKLEGRRIGGGRDEAGGDGGGGGGERGKEQERHGWKRSGRFARHAGPHDAGGLQRLISTGTLAPTLLRDPQVSSSNSIDLIFATYWFYPADTQIVLPEQQECIDEWMNKESQRLDPQNVFYGLDHDAYEHMARDECVKAGADTKRRQQAALSKLSPVDVYPFNFHTGEMTVYRLRLTCRCHAGALCTKVLPYGKQQWAGYMGKFGNSYFTPRV